AGGAGGATPISNSYGEAGSQYQGGGGAFGGGGSGGGGYYGGGGGALYGAGGGGSSYTDYAGFSGTNVNGGANNATYGWGSNGRVIITYNAMVSGGCDTPKTLNLTIKYFVYDTVSVTECGGYTW